MLAAAVCCCAALAFAPPAPAALQHPPASAASAAFARTSVVTMLERKRLDKATGKWIKETVDDEKVAFTVRRLVLAQGAVAAIFATALLSGKSIDQYNAPGYTEAAAAKAEKKRQYLAETEARRQALAEQAAADRAAGRPSTPPPKPWER